MVSCSFVTQYIHNRCVCRFYCKLYIATLFWITLGPQYMWAPVKGHLDLPDRFENNMGKNECLCWAMTGFLLILPKGRYNLALPVVSCTSCGLMWSPSVKDFQGGGYWPGTLNFCTLFSMDVFQSFYDIKKLQQGCHLRPLSKCWMNEQPILEGWVSKFVKFKEIVQINVYDDCPWIFCCLSST